MLFKFQSLLKVTDHLCHIDYNDDTLISDILNQCSSTVTFIVRLLDLNHDIYSVNLSKILQHMRLPDTVLTVDDFVNDFMTMSLLTSYHEPRYNMSNRVQFLSEADIADTTTIQAYNLINGDKTDIFDSPSYPDLLVSNTGIDMSHVYPVVNGLIFKQIIRTEGLVLQEGTTVLREAELDGFLYIPKVSESLSLSTVVANNYVIDDREFILVLNGVWIPKSSGIYKVIGAYNRLVIDFNLLANLNILDDQVTQGDIEANLNSFLIQFDSEIVMESKVEDIREFYKSYEHFNQYRHDDPSSTIVTTRTFRLVPFTCMEDKFKFKVLPRAYFRDDVYTKDDDDHVYWKVFI